jgi:hypothetical protein
MRALLVFAAAAMTIVPAAHADRCVFRVPLKEAAILDDLWYRVHWAYGLMDRAEDGPDGSCTPSRPARDRLDRPGWRRVVCVVTFRAKTDGTCEVTRPGGDGRDTAGPCTGTLWQQVDIGSPYVDTGARFLRFRVVLRQHPVRCGIVARWHQLPPYNPRLKRPRR